MVSLFLLMRALRCATMAHVQKLRRKTVAILTGGVEAQWDGSVVPFRMPPDLHPATEHCCPDRPQTATQLQQPQSGSARASGPPANLCLIKTFF